MRHSLGAAVLAAALSFSATRAVHAQDKAAAEALFDDGKKLMIAGQYAEACGKLEQSQRIDPGIGTLLYLAECYEKSGRTASAWATFREAASSARAAGQGDRARVGQQRADRLEPSLSRLTIQVAPQNLEIEGFEVLRGGRAVSRAVLNTPLPVDPGEQAIEARAPGYKPFTIAVRIDPGAATASVAVPALERDPSSPLAPTGSTASSEDGKTYALAPPALNPVSSEQDRGSNPGATQRTLAFVTGGVGVVGLGVGTFFGLRAMSKNSDAEDICPRNRCNNERGLSLTDEAEDAALISNIAFGVGAAALIGGAVLYFTAPKAAQSAHGLQITPVASQRGGTMLLRGEF